jgi:hypothetical protein
MSEATMEFEKVELSNGEVVEIKPLTVKQARACKLSTVMRNIMKNMEVELDENGNPKTKSISPASMIPEEDDVIRVVKVVYPKVEELSYSEALNIFWKIINNEMGKLM